MLDGMSSTSKLRPRPAETDPALGPRFDGRIRRKLCLDLVVDSAGKVRSAAPADPTKGFNADLPDATAEWKFIPAFKDGRAVASRVRVSLSSER